MMPDINLGCTSRVRVHVRQTMKHEDSYFINPGSATGAYSTTTPDAQPSFVLMDIDGSRVRWHVLRQMLCKAAASSSFCKVGR